MPNKNLIVSKSMVNRINRDLILLEADMEKRESGYLEEIKKIVNKVNILIQTSKIAPVDVQQLHPDAE